MNYYKKSIIDARKEVIMDGFKFNAVINTLSLVITSIIFFGFKSMPSLMSIVVFILIFSLVGAVIYTIGSILVSIKLNKEY